MAAETLAAEMKNSTRLGLHAVKLECHSTDQPSLSSDAGLAQRPL